LASTTALSPPGPRSGGRTSWGWPAGTSWARYRASRWRTADLVYTGKGALIWMPDLKVWAREAARLLRPGGYLFVYEGHPAVPLWTWDEDAPRIRDDRSYFARSHVNDSFPARGATEWQHTLGQVVTAVIAAGLELLSLAEYPEPFWRPGGVSAAAWDGRLPNAYSLLARRPAVTASS
jgi:SAM-dependent methyltransferase